MDAQLLKKLYWKNGMSLRDIAKKFGFKNHKTISYYFNKFNITRREAKEYSANTFKQKPIIRKTISNTLKEYYTKHDPQFLGKKHTNESKMKIRKNTINMLKTGKIGSIDTKIEKKIENHLLFNNILYIKQYSYDLGIADFWLPESNTIIMCDGDYWHSLPSCKERDENQVIFLENSNFIVYRFTETDINNNFNMIRNTLELNK